ncbi:uncharacterized protein [Physcomitrium patens]|uniref:uncharacterized protein n=1 Tax=Physcomitrium patens TaxID=3218 RepID=UPI003CCD103A
MVIGSESGHGVSSSAATQGRENWSTSRGLQLAASPQFGSKGYAEGPPIWRLPTGPNGQGPSVAVGSLFLPLSNQSSSGALMWQRERAMAYAQTQLQASLPACCCCSHCSLYLSCCTFLSLSLSLSFFALTLRFYKVDEEMVGDSSERCRVAATGCLPAGSS